MRFLTPIFKHRFYLLLNFWWAIPCVFLMRALKPIVFIRLGRIWSNRIGEFIAETSNLLANRKTQNFTSYDFIFFSDISNRHWATMVKRSHNVVRPWVKYIWYWNRFIPGGDCHSVVNDLTNHDREGLLAKVDTRIPFLPEETQDARNWLKSKGWKEEEPFICLLVRDSKYEFQFNVTSDKGGLLNAQREEISHSYRDSDIVTYLPAMKWLAKQGVWVLRMGRVMSTPVLTSEAKIIDYAFDEAKSDLLDIWLFANCTACISTGSGPDSLTWTYRRPQLVLNFLPLGKVYSFSSSLTVPKNLKWSNSGKSLTLSEHLNVWDKDSIGLSESGINYVDLTPEEISLAVEEFWNRLGGTWESSKSDIDLQESFWTSFQQWSEYSRFHGWKHPESRIGARWLASQDPDFLH